MSPARQPNGSPRRKKSTQKPSLVPLLQTERYADSPAADKKGRAFDPHAFLASIGEGRKAMFFREHKLSDLFVAYLLARNIRYEEDLVDQLFYFSEKRLARILLPLTHFGKEGVPETVVPKVRRCWRK